MSITSLFFVTTQSYSRPQSYAYIDWQYEIVYTSIENCKLYDEPDESANIVDSLNMLTKLVIIKSPLENFGVGWNKCVFPVKGFVRSKFLVPNDPSKITDADLQHRIKIRTLYDSWDVDQTYSETDYAFVKSQPSYTSENVGVIKDGDRVLFVKDGNNESNLWIKIIYPVEGYVLSADFSISGTGSNLSIAVSYGVLNIPYEKNLRNDFNPIGGMLEYSLPDWRLGIRLDYSYFRSHLKEYTLKTHLAYLQIRYTLFSLFDNHLETYAAAGGGYWMSSFQNLKYPSLKDYFTEEKDKDFAYTVSSGAIYHLGNFYIDAQYIFIGTREGRFGKEPVSGEFTNLYKVYPAANHVNIFLGYTFRF